MRWSEGEQSGDVSRALRLCEQVKEVRIDAKQQRELTAKSKGQIAHNLLKVVKFTVRCYIFQILTSLCAKRPCTWPLATLLTLALAGSSPICNHFRLHPLTRSPLLSNEAANRSHYCKSPLLSRKDQDRERDRAVRWRAVEPGSNLGSVYFVHPLALANTLSNLK